MTPIAAVPAAFLQYSRLQPRPKGFENRLTDAETARMVELQNANIRAEEKKLGRKLTNTEKLTIISSTQRNFWAGLMLPTGTPGGYMGPGTQSFNPGTGTGTKILDSVHGDKQQTPVNIANETGRQWVRITSPVVTVPTKALYDFGKGQFQQWGDISKGAVSRVADDLKKSPAAQLALLAAVGFGLYWLLRARK